ncbi:Retrotran_gag_3 domain-containing protein [Hirschfeldia incana]|nr:Retrotran_gag_3 domain-containing protein [Hirschfeldia incana]
MSLSPTHDPESPYYLDPDLRPENKLSTVILREAEDNYFIWKRDVLESLRIRNKTGFVDGTLVRPDPSSPLHDAWKLCNDMVACWLINSVSPALQFYVFFAETAHKAWDDIRRIFSPSSEFKIYELRCKIAMMTQGGGSVASFYAKLDLAWQELSEYDPVPECSCGGCRCEITKRAKEKRDKEKAFGFLIGSNNDVNITHSLVYALNVDWKIHQLRETTAMPMQGGRSLSIYFQELDLAWQELSEYHPLPECTCGGCVCDVAKRASEAREKEKLFGFLMGLDRKLGKGMARIMLMKPRPSFNQAYSLLVNWTSS